MSDSTNYASGDEMGRLWQRCQKAEQEVERLNAVIAAKLHQRRCWDCGCVFWATTGVAPGCLCEKCGSQDTRRVKDAKVKGGGDGE